MMFTKAKILAWLEMTAQAAAAGAVAYALSQFQDGIPSGFSAKAFASGALVAALVAVRNRFATPPTNLALSQKANSDTQVKP